MRTQRGYSLIIAVTIIALLSMVGVMVLDSVASDTQLAGGDRAAINAMYVAEAGAVWAKQAAVDLLFPPGSGSGLSSAAVSAVIALPALAQGDDICPENKCVEQPCPKATDCTQWHLLTPGGWVPYGPNGSYRAAVTCLPACTTNPMPQGYSVRAMGMVGDKSQRLIEITLGGN